jgi:hypothetical protein
VKEKILKNSASEAKYDANAAIEDAKAKGHRAGMITDGWTNVNRVGIEGVILTLGCLVFLLPSVMGGTIHHGVAVAMMIEKLLFVAYKDLHTFHYFCCDDAGQCGRARRILSLRYPEIFFMCCWTHQINLMV